MRSISTRLAVWHSLTATATLACLFVVGYYLLENRLIHGLDLLNSAEFEQIKAHLGQDYKGLTPEVIDQRIRETTEYASVLFYINIHSPSEKNLFRSTNLNGRAIPDPKGMHAFNAKVDSIGELRVAEFPLAPFDVSIATPLSQVREVMEGYVDLSLTVLAGMLFASTGIGFVLSRLALRPLRDIRATANRIRSDNLSERIPVSDTNDEVSELARLLNQVFDRLEASFNQIRQFTAELSHELKTPLSLVRLYAEKLLVDGHLAPAHEDALQAQLEELARLNQIIEELLFLSRAEAQAIKLELTSHQPSCFLQSFAQDAVVLVEHHGRRFDYTHHGEGDVTFEQKWMWRVLLNLVTNALNASPPDGRITLRSVLADGVWRVGVEDEGSGLPPEHRERIFERFVRISRPGVDTGSGLGLTICRSIVALHGGRIFADVGPNGYGLRVVFEIPAGRSGFEAAMQ